MRFFFGDQSDLTARDAAELSGVAEADIVTAFSQARRAERPGFNVGGKHFGIVGAQEPPPKAPKPLLDQPPPADVAPERPGSTCIPKHTPVFRKPGEQVTAEKADDPQPLADRVFPRSPPPMPPAATAPSPVDPPLKADLAPIKQSTQEDHAMQRSSRDQLWETKDLPGEQLTRDQIATRFQVKRNSVVVALAPSGKKRVGGHDWRPAGSPASDAPPRAPKTRRARKVPTPVAVTTPAEPPVLAISGLDAQRERYRQMMEQEVAAAKARYELRLSVLDDLDKQQAG